MIPGLKKNKFTQKLATGAALTGVLAAVGMASAPAQAQSVPISFNWDWEIVIDPGVPGLPGPTTLNLWGPTTINFAPPSPFFDLGTQDNPLPTPPGGPFTIPTEISSMNLVGTSPVLRNVVLRQSATQPSIGKIQNLTNVGGNLTANSFFDLVFELEFDNPLIPGTRMTLFSDNPQTPEVETIPVGMDFTLADQIPAIDTFWLPTWLWAEFRVNSPELVDRFGVKWDTVIRIHAHQTTPEPSSLLGLLAFGGLGLGMLRKKQG